MVYVLMIHFSCTYNVLLDCITIDSLLSAVQFTKENLAKSKNEKFSYWIYPIIKNIKMDITVSQNGGTNESPTTINILSRYIYYVLLQIMYWICKIFVWHNHGQYTYYIFMFSTIPSIMIIIKNMRYVSNIMNNIEKKADDIINKTKLQLCCKFINNILSGILDSDPKINPNELEIFYRRNSSLDVTNFVKMFAISILIEYLESTKSSYLKLVKLLYDYGVIIDLKQDNAIDKKKYDRYTDCKKKVQKIVENRDWDHMFTQSNLTNIVHLYKINKKTSLSEMINSYIYEIELLTGKLFAYYSITTLFGGPFPAAILSIYMMYILSGEYNVYLICVKGFSVILWYFGYNLWYVSAVSELSEFMHNHITIFLLRKITISITNYISKIMFLNMHTYTIVLNCILAFILGHEDVQNKYSSLIMILVCLSNKNIFLSSLIMICGSTSNYSSAQLSYIMFIATILTNMYIVEQESEKNKLKIINSYIKKTISMDNMNNSVVENNYGNIIINSQYLADSEYKNASISKEESKKNSNSSVLESISDIDDEDEDEKFIKDQNFLSSGIIVPKNSNLSTVYNLK